MVISQKKQTNKYTEKLVILQSVGDNNYEKQGNKGGLQILLVGIHLLL